MVLVELEKELFSKENFWDLMQQNVDAPFIHFEDYPELAGYVSADGSHISADGTASVVS